MPPAVPGPVFSRLARGSADFGRFVLAGEPLAAALHGGDELRKVDLEGVEDLVGVVLGAEADLALTRARVLHDVLGRALGLLGDLLLAHQALLALARVLDDPFGLLLGLREHLLALLDDPARLLDLLGDRRAHLVEDVVDLLLVDPHLVSQGHGLCVVHQVVELVYQYEDIHLQVRTSVRSPARFRVQWPDLTFAILCATGLRPIRQRLSSSRSRLATPSGTRSSMRPPNVASSLTPLEERKLYCGLAIKYTDSTCGSWLRFSWLISSSYSKSEIARSPLTIAFAPTLCANSTTSVENGSARTPWR